MFRIWLFWLPFVSVNNILMGLCLNCVWSFEIILNLLENNMLCFRPLQAGDPLRQWMNEWMGDPCSWHRFVDKVVCNCLLWRDACWHPWVAGMEDWRVDVVGKHNSFFSHKLHRYQHHMYYTTQQSSHACVIQINKCNIWNGYQRNEFMEVAASNLGPSSCHFSILYLLFAMRGISLLLLASRGICPWL